MDDLNLLDRLLSSEKNNACKVIHVIHKQFVIDQPV
jgi:hypothetical protein